MVLLGSVLGVRGVNCPLMQRVADATILQARPISHREALIQLDFKAVNGERIEVSVPELKQDFFFQRVGSLGISFCF